MSLKKLTFNIEHTTFNFHYGMLSFIFIDFGRSNAGGKNFDQLFRFIYHPIYFLKRFNQRKSVDEFQPSVRFP